MAMRSRSFSVPAGTVLSNGFTVPERISVTLPYDDNSLTPGQAQKAAGRAALDQLGARYGVQPKDIGGFAGLQRSTRAVQAATPSRPLRAGETAAPTRARGGRKPTAIKLKVTAEKGRHVYLDLSKMPKSWTAEQRFSALKGAVGQAARGQGGAPGGSSAFAVIQTGGTSLADETGYEPPTSDGDDEEDEFIFQTAAFTSEEAFERAYPDAESFEQSSSIALDGTADFSIMLRVD